MTVQHELFVTRVRMKESRSCPTDCDPGFIEHTEDRKGLKQTSFLNDSGKTLFADIVYPQNFVFEEKKEETNVS